MGQKYQPNYEKAYEIYLKEIIFEKNSQESDVTIFGYFNDFLEDNLVQIDYCCDFSILTDLLIFAKEDGEPVISAITEKLNEEIEEIPVIIDVENIFGRPLKIEGIVMTIYIPFEEDENGEWHESEDRTAYIIDSIEPKEEYEKKQTKNNGAEDDLAELFILVDNAYLYYKQLLKIGISKKIARKQSGLKNELLFRIADLNNQILKQNSK